MLSLHFKFKPLFQRCKIHLNDTTKVHRARLAYEIRHLIKFRNPTTIYAVRKRRSIMTLMQKLIYFFFLYFFFFFTFAIIRLATAIRFRNRDARTRAESHLKRIPCIARGDTNWRRPGCIGVLCALYCSRPYHGTYIRHESLRRVVFRRCGDHRGPIARE